MEKGASYPWLDQWLGGSVGSIVAADPTNGAMAQRRLMIRVFCSVGTFLAAAASSASLLSHYLHVFQHKLINIHQSVPWTETGGSARRAPRGTRTPSSAVAYACGRDPRPSGPRPWRQRRWRQAISRVVTAVLLVHVRAELQLTWWTLQRRLIRPAVRAVAAAGGRVPSLPEVKSGEGSESKSRGRESAARRRHHPHHQQQPPRPHPSSSSS